MKPDQQAATLEMILNKRSALAELLAKHSYGFSGLFHSTLKYKGVSLSDSVSKVMTEFGDVIKTYSLGVS